MTESRAVERYRQGKITNVDLAEQQRVCLELRLQYHTIREISALTGLSVGTVHNRIQEALALYVSPYVEQYRVMERERLEGLSRRVLQTMSTPHYVLKDGNVVTLNDEPIEDVAVTLGCVDRLLRISAQRAKLLGLETPAQPDDDSAPVTEDIELAKLILAAKARATEQAEALRTRE
jgi:hypothetical protein